MILNVCKNRLVETIRVLKIVDKELHYDLFNLEKCFDEETELSKEFKDIIISILGYETQLKFLLQDIIDNLKINKEFLCNLD